MSKFMGRPFVCALFLGLLCTWGLAGEEKTLQPATDDEKKAVVAGNNAFALDLYAKLKDKEQGNLFFSPYSISTALAMTYAGARGETAAQMRKTLGFTLDDARLHPAFAGTIEALNAGGKENYELTVANSLWGEKTTKFLQPFLELTQACYGGGLNQVDFKTAWEAARLTINKWVEDKTKEKIKDLIPPKGVNDSTRLVLVNAVYFKGKWEIQFDKNLTKDAPFHLTASQTANVPLMSQGKANDVAYFKGKDFQAVELGYKGKGISMVIFLPDKVDGLKELEAQCTADNLGKWLGGLWETEVNVSLPKFKLTWGTKDLGPSGNKALPELGMKDPFNDAKADFSGMNGFKPPSTEALYISAVFHKAFVDVNEEGTEAAAATAVIMTRGAGLPSKPKVFKADHPFLFLIRETKTGGILFLGRVMNPQ